MYRLTRRPRGPCGHETRVGTSGYVPKGIRPAHEWGSTWTLHFAHLESSGVDKKNAKERKKLKILLHKKITIYFKMKNARAVLPYIYRWYICGHRCGLIVFDLFYCCRFSTMRSYCGSILESSHTSYPELLRWPYHMVTTEQKRDKLPPASIMYHTLHWNEKPQPASMWQIKF